MCDFGGHFSISVAIFRPFQARGHFPFSFPFSPDFCAGPVSHSSEKNKGGWKTQGRGKHTIKPLPKNGFGPPPPMTRFPPPFVHALSFSLEQTCTDQTNPTF